MTIRSEAEINRLLASTAAEYADEERTAAEEESRAAAASAVLSVRAGISGTRVHGDPQPGLASERRGSSR